MDPDLSNSIITVTVTAPQWGVTVRSTTSRSESRTSTVPSDPGSGSAAGARFPGRADHDHDQPAVMVSEQLRRSPAVYEQPGVQHRPVPAVHRGRECQWSAVRCPYPAGPDPSRFGTTGTTSCHTNHPAEGHGSDQVEQPVVEYHQAQPSVFLGWDDRSLYYQRPVVADDCSALTGVCDRHPLVGSFINWTQPDPPQLPAAFHIAIWTDVPAGSVRTAIPARASGRRCAPTLPGTSPATTTTPADNQNEPASSSTSI